MFSSDWRTPRVWALAFALRWQSIGVPAATAFSACQPNGDPATVSPAVVVVYDQPPSPAGGLIPSALRDPNGSATDQWAWDAFVLSTTTDVTEIQWHGGHDPTKYGSGGSVTDFTVSIYASIPAATQPDLSGPPLAHFEVGSNASETAGLVMGGVQMYDYSFVLPAPFRADAGVKYWVQIEAFQPGPSPDWGLTKGTGGDGQYFRRRAGEFIYETVTGDTSFALLGTRVAGYHTYFAQIVG